MKLRFLLMLLNILIVNVIGSDFVNDKLNGYNQQQQQLQHHLHNSENNNKEIVLLVLDYDPAPRAMPQEWMERFYASTQSPRNYNRRKLIDLLKKKKISEH